MLKIYFVSILIWMMIIFCAAYLFEDAIKQKGWIDSNKHSKFVSVLFTLFCMSAIPVLRLLFLVVILFMAGVSKEEFEEMSKSNNDKL